MFYLSHRAIVRALVTAHERGAGLRVLLDPNRDAFGRKKDGVPNRQVALELHRAGIPVRWCNTDGEQCHGKMLVVEHADGTGTLLAGSANFTRRNLDNLNLETNVQVRRGTMPVLADAAAFFDARWNNEPGRVYSLAYEAFADSSPLRYWRYRFMEWSGWSSFPACRDRRVMPPHRAVLTILQDLTFSAHIRTPAVQVWCVALLMTFSKLRASSQMHPWMAVARYW
ncbi:MAG: phospholipase D-like domain-containing protein [Woeseiaceae bacterium]|nr:phospholipase D-like domain-containing protein [Woeseiaceae bacterium]